MSASKKIFGLIATALMMGALAGCGGGGGNNPVLPDNVNVNGGIPTDEGQAVDGSGQPITITAGAQRTVDLIVDGQTVRDVVVAPVTQNVPAGTSLAVFPANVPIIENLQLNGLAVTRDPGQLIINGTVIEGVTIDDNGRLSDPIAFAPTNYVQSGSYQADFDGPWSIVGGNRRLDVGQFTVIFQVDTQGNSSFPATISGRLPSNGGSTLDGESVVGFTISPAFAGGSARLTVEKSNGDLSKLVEVPGTSGSFSDLNAQGGNPVIPANGVDRVIFSYNPQND
ncbi:MAG: hypothetical protein ACO1SV_19605 [Fimbriimonas sp.]